MAARLDPSEFHHDPSKSRMSVSLLDNAIGVSLTAGTRLCKHLGLINAERTPDIRDGAPQHKPGEAFRSDFRSQASLSNAQSIQAGGL